MSTSHKLAAPQKFFFSLFFSDDTSASEKAVSLHVELMFFHIHVQHAMQYWYFDWQFARINLQPA